MASSENMEILEGSAPTTGGLVVRKKKSEKNNEDEVKGSRLGLDKLAGSQNNLVNHSCYHSYVISLSISEEKRLEKLKEALLKSLEEESFKDKDSEGFAKPVSRSDKKSKSYRVYDETPTYTGGVSEEARNRQESRDHRDKQRKFHTSTKVIMLIKNCFFKPEWLT